MSVIRVRGLGKGGVNVDANPLDLLPIELTLAQNALNDPHGADGGLRKRPGLLEVNTSTAAGSIVGGAFIPLAYKATPNNTIYPFASSITTSSATLTDATGLSVGDTVWWFDSSGIVQETAPATLLTVSGNDVTWFPALSGTPTTSDYFLPSPAKVAYLGISDDGAGADGWVVSPDQFTTVSVVNTTNASPQVPRQASAGTSSGFDDAAQWAIGSCVLNDVLYYAGGNYTIGTDHPPIRVWDGHVDRELCRIPSNHDVSASNVPVGVVAMVPGQFLLNGTYKDGVYLSTLDTGQSDGSTNKGRVFFLYPPTGYLVQMGATFTVKHNPSVLLYAFGRLWCGTDGGNSETSFQATVQWIFPGITGSGFTGSWTTDTTFSAGYDGVTGLASYQGVLFAATKTNDASVQATVYKRDMSAGTWSASDAFSGETNAHGYTSLLVYKNLLHAIKWSSNTAAMLIRSYNGTSWSTAFTASTAAQKVPLVLWTDGTASTSAAYATSAYANNALLLKSTNGTSWTDKSSVIPDNTNVVATPLVGSIPI